MEESPNGADSGWGRPWLQALLNIVLPFRFLFSRGSQRTLLELMRMIFLSIAVALLLLLFVLTFVVPWTTQEQVPTVVWLLLAAGLVGPAGASWARGRAVPCRAGAELARAYQQRMFVGVAFGEAPALLGFVAAFQADAIWPYLVGMALSLIALGMVAPTEGDVERKETQLRAGGCAQSLREALSSAPDDA